MDGNAMKGLLILTLAPFVGAALVAMAYTPGEPQHARTSIPASQKKAQALQVPPSKPARGHPAFKRFRSEAMAKAYCDGETVVWTDTRRKVYHLSGSYFYGRTRLGGYMCEKDTASAGFNRAGVKQDAGGGLKTAAEQSRQATR
jgi:hypothetical protein